MQAEMSLSHQGRDLHLILGQIWTLPLSTGLEIDFWALSCVGRVPPWQAWHELQDKVLGSLPCSLALLSAIPLSTWLRRDQKFSLQVLIWEQRLWDPV